MANGKTDDNGDRGSESGNVSDINGNGTDEKMNHKKYKQTDGYTEIERRRQNIIY